MASDGNTGATYALSASHKEVRNGTFRVHEEILTASQLLEKSLVDSDPEVAEIMVSLSIPVSTSPC